MLSALKRWLGSSLADIPATSAASVPTADAKRAYELAVECFATGDLQAAETHARNAAELQHDHVDAHMLVAQLCHQRGAYDDAADCYLLASCFAPDAAEPHVRLALLSLDRGDHVQALEYAARAIELDPREARAINAAGAASLALERVDEARAHFETALDLNPDFVEAHSNLGYLLFRDFEEFEGGHRHIRRALELAPEDATVLTNYSMIMVRDRPAEVVELCNRLLARDGTLDPVRLNRGLAHLTLGNFELGWPDYEARKSVRCNYVPRAMPWPEWQGGDLAGHGIYVHTEQGLGDEIMFASCLPELIAAADRCTIECAAKLAKTFGRSFDAQVVVKPKDDAQLVARAGPGIDCYIALGSLPRILRTSQSRFPDHGGYLKPDMERVRHWRNRLGELPGALKVGIAWRGGVASTQRSIRSTTLKDWLPVLSVQNVDFVDMQHFESADEVSRLRTEHATVLHRFHEAHDDYDDTAALVSALDLVISVQTALVHLGGALGKETWALISAAPEWRYLAHGARMPWYPAVRLVRQERLRDWSAPIEAVAAWLRERVRGCR